MKRVLVTGASGFVGRHALDPLIARDFEVHAVSRSIQPRRAGVAWHQTDLLAEGAVDLIVHKVSPTHLLHLAWCTQHGDYWCSPENLAWIARSLDLVRAFRDAGGERAVVAGTCAEYDWAGAADAWKGPTTLYGATKGALRDVLIRYGAVTGLSVAWGRIYFPFGPGEQPGRVVPLAARGIVSGRRVELTSGRQVRDFLYVEDVAEAFAALVASNSAGTFEIGSGTGLTLGDLVRRLELLGGTNGLMLLGALEDRDEPVRIVAETTRITREIGWRPRVPLDEGLRRTLDWWRRSQDVN